jgi:plasmid stabilization system protein ParE
VALPNVGRIVLFVAADNRVAANRVGSESVLAGDGPALIPHRGLPGRKAGTRELVVMSSYIIVYRVPGQDNVPVLRVWHAARDRRRPRRRPSVKAAGSVMSSPLQPSRSESEAPAASNREIAAKPFDRLA